MNLKQRLLRTLPWLILLAAFIAFGFWVRTIMPWEGGLRGRNQIYSLDYHRYGQMLNDWRRVFYTCFRHPLYGILMSPVIGLSARFRELGEWPFWGWLITFFSGVMTFAHYLLYRLLRRLALDRLTSAVLTMLFASCAASWLLAACPESFNISCLLALVTLHFALYVHRHEGALDPRLEYAGWGSLAIATGGITCTQVVKTAIAYWVTRRPCWKYVLWGFLGILGAGLIVGILFSIRLYLIVGGDDFEFKFTSAIANNILKYFARSWMPLERQIECVFIFFSEPFVTRGAPFSQMRLPGGYASPIAAILSVLPALAALVSGWVARRDFIVRLIVAMLLVDVGIHFVLAWGLNEAQLYAGHWYYAVPILIGVGLVRMTRRFRCWASVAIVLYSATILALNLHAWVAR